MSLDVYLIVDDNITVKKGTGIRENGGTIELTPDQVKERYPDYVIEESSDEYSTYITNEIDVGNITHNLGEMAEKAGLYDTIWRPYRLHPDYKKEYEDTDKEYEFEDNHNITAGQILNSLKIGYQELTQNPEKYKKFNPENGWGTYEQLCKFTENYIVECSNRPNAKVVVSR